MLVAVAIVAGFAVILNFVLLGGILGYLAYGYLATQAAMMPDHPEFYDSEGNIIPDEIVTIRFEGSMDDWDDEE